MNSLLFRVLCVLWLAGLASFGRAAPVPMPGALAPVFSLPDQQGMLHTLSQYRGKWVVLYFYPKDNTPGCTTEAMQFRDHHKDFVKAGAELGLSRQALYRKMERLGIALERRLRE